MYADCDRTRTCVKSLCPYCHITITIWEEGQTGATEISGLGQGRQVDSRGVSPEILIVQTQQLPLVAGEKLGTGGWRVGHFAKKKTHDHRANSTRLRKRAMRRAGLNG
jgi:hypothetical protein